MIEAYGVDAELNRIELGGIELEEAIGLLRDRHAFDVTGCDSIEQGIASTRIGFARAGERDLIELDFPPTAHIVVRYERRLAARLPIRRRREVDIAELATAEVIVADYFHLSAEDFDVMFKGYCGSGAR